jgi:hypothetical protein
MLPLSCVLLTVLFLLLSVYWLLFPSIASCSLSHACCSSPLTYHCRFTCLSFPICANYCLFLVCCCLSFVCMCLACCWPACWPCLVLPVPLLFIVPWLLLPAFSLVWTVPLAAVDCLMLPVAWLLLLVHYWPSPVPYLLLLDSYLLLPLPGLLSPVVTCSLPVVALSRLCCCLSWGFCCLPLACYFLSLPAVAYPSPVPVSLGFPLFDLEKHCNM